MQHLIKRATQQVLRQRLNKVLPVVSQIHVAPVMICSVPKYTFCVSTNSMGEESFDRVTSYENLISRISSSVSVNEILRVFSVNEQLMKNEHVVLSLRMMARLLRSTQQSELENITNDERYQKLTERAANAIDSLNEYEVLDFLFWMRKFRVARININMNEESLDKFYNKINEFLKTKSFNFRNLVNLYYDYSFINRASHDICLELLRELKSDSKLLTPFTVIQILQAASRKNTFRQTQELMLADYVTRNFQNLLDEFDTDQKCVLFKYLSALELNFNPPRFKLPYILYMLRNQLKDKLDQLSEASVINIVQAYGSLPKEFPIDLLEEIKDMVVITIQHNSQNIKTFFLLDFIDSVQSLRRRRLDDKKVAVLAQELQNRLMHDEFLQKPRNLERLVQMYDNGLRHDAILQAIKDFLKSYDKKQIQMSLYEFLARKKVDMTEYLDALFKSHDISQLGNYNQCRLYILLKFIPNNEQFQPQIEQLQSHIDTMAESNPGRLVNIFKISTVYGETRKLYMDKCIAKLQSDYLGGAEKKKHQEISNFFKNLFLSMEVRDQKENWINWLNANQEQFDEYTVSRAIDTFFNQQKYTVDQFVVFFHLLSLDNYSKLSLKRILFILKDSKNFVTNLMRYDGLFKRFLNILMQGCQKQPQNIRLQYIYAFVTRVKNIGHSSDVYKRFLKKVFEQYKENSGNNEVSNQTEFMFALMLMEENVLQTRYATEIYDKNENNIGDILLKAKFFSYCLQNSNAEYRDSKAQYTQQLLEELSQYLSSSHNVKVLNALSVYLSYPSEYVSQNKDLLMKTMKDFIGQGNERLYVKLIFSLNARYVKNHYDLYFPFIKEMIQAYPNYRKRIPISIVIDILGKFVSLNCKYPTIYNYILEDIGQNFNLINAEQRVKSLESFGTLQIKQSDFFQKNLEKIEEQPYQFRGYLRSILQSLYKVGYDSEGADKLVNSIVESIMRNESVDEGFAYIRYLPVLNAPNEAEIFEKIFNSLPEERNEHHQKYRNRGEIVLLNEFFKNVYPNKPEWQKKIKVYLGEEEEQFNKTRENYFKPTNNNTINNASFIGEYLKVMKLEYQQFVEHNGLTVDMIIPEKKVIVKIIQARDTNFDRSSFNGRTAVFKRVFSALDPEYKVVLINNIEFRASSDDISKINLLVAEGIESNVTDGNYDFSTIDKQQYQNQNRRNSTASVASEESQDSLSEDDLSLKEDISTKQQ